MAAAKPDQAQASISIATVNGSPYTGQVLHVGDTLTFATTIPKLAGWQYPMIALVCFQDVNEDSTTDTDIAGPDIVYSQLEKPDATFSLGGTGSSIWTHRIEAGYPSAAIGRADLDAYGWKGGNESVSVLAFTDFMVA